MRRGGRRRPERADPLLIAGRRGQQQVRGDPLGRGTLASQDLGGRRVPGLALTGRKVLIQRRAHDRVHESQALSRKEDVRPYQVICRLSGVVLAQAGHPGGQQRLAVISEYGDRSRQLGRRGTERSEPVQDEAAHHGRSHVLDCVRRGRRRRHLGGGQGSQQLPQEERVTPGGRVAGAAELLGCVGAQAFPRQRHRGGLAQRPRIQRGCGGTRGQLHPQCPRLVSTGIRGPPGEQHRHRKPLDPLRQVGRNRNASRSAHWRWSTSTAPGHRRRSSPTAGTDCTAPQGPARASSAPRSPGTAAAPAGPAAPADPSGLPGPC